MKNGTVVKIISVVAVLKTGILKYKLTNNTKLIIKRRIIMGTRGLYGFRKNGVDKLTYNHWDSYPNCLGESMVKFCRETSIEEMNEIFDRIILVIEDSTPTKEQIDECSEFYNGGVSTGQIDEWYCLLRETQGNPNVYKHGLRYMIDNQGFINDSLFCEYAYIINLDEECLEFYVGFQKEPDEYNRYGTGNNDGYYPCKLLKEYSLGEINESLVEKIIKDMEYLVEREYAEDTDEAEEERDVTVDDFDDIAYAIQNCSTSGVLDNGIKWHLEFDI
jgi:hypothetical protein